MKMPLSRKSEYYLNQLSEKLRGSAYPGYMKSEDKLARRIF